MSVSDFGHTISLLFTPWGLNAAAVIGSVIDHSVQVSSRLANLSAQHNSKIECDHSRPSS